MMKKVMLVVCCFLFVAAIAYAEIKANKVTGSVLAVSAEKIVIKKGKGEWEIARDAATKTTGDVKVGSKVTIEYKMTAKSIEVKESATKKSTKKK
ncbi:MAG TPA: hypothetical protein P5294_00215 [Smithellaceae bacterium]|nr:hypothetical protein [Smithellaceae bacterium]HRS88285.1 hypothetical protein [Smithellaceae bacterium]HRV24930.1 hypothetical protein [Smithellaceae bacterium]